MWAPYLQMEAAVLLSFCFGEVKGRARGSAYGKGGLFV